MLHKICCTAVTAVVALSLAAPVLAQTVHVVGIDSIHIRSNLQAQFNTTSVDEEPDTAWEVRRARIMIRMFAAGWVRADLEGDFGRGGPRLTDGFVRLDFDPRFRLRAGQYKKPFDALELVSSRQLLVVERDGAPRGSDLPTPNGLVKDAGYSDRDIGAEWSGDFGAATLVAGFWNGEGGNDEEIDDGKQVGVRAEVEGPAGLTLAAAWSGIRFDPFELGDGVVDDRGDWRHAFEVAGEYGEYGAPGAKALVQVMAGDGVPTDDLLDLELGEPRFVTVHGIAAYHVAIWETPYVIGIEPVVRVGWADPDDDLDDDEATLLTAGINLYHHAHVKTQLQVDHLRPAEGEGETAARLQLTLGF
jgi:hypothetical protein